MMRAPSNVRLHDVPGTLAAALLVAAPVLDVLGLASGRSGVSAVGALALGAGTIAGVVAAAAGLAPYVALPPRWRDRRRAARHAAAALFALALCALARWVRGHHEVPPDPPIVAAECVAAAIVLATSIRARRARRRRAAATAASPSQTRTAG
jgi:uncharacterized membrane protein